MSALRVFFVNRFYWPDEPATAQLLGDLAADLARAGHPVTVITTHPAGRTAPRCEAREGVTICRVRATHWGRRQLAGRVVDILSFQLGAVWTALRRVRRGDVLVSLTDPPLLGPLLWFVAALHGARLIHWVQDIYPEIAAELTGHRWLLLTRPLRDLAWRRAAACVVPGEDMSRALVRAGVPAHHLVVSANWAPAGLTPPPDEAVAALRRAWGLEGRFVVGYSGNLGRVHDLDPVLDLAHAFRDDPAVTFLFVGHGARRPALEAEVRARKLPNVHFRPPSPRPDLAATLGVADVHLVTLLPGAERWVFPSKLYGIAAAGRPVLFLGSPACELARLVVRHGLGAAFARDDLAAITSWLTRMRAADATTRRDFADAAHTFAAGGFRRSADQWRNLIDPALAAR